MTWLPPSVPARAAGGAVSPTAGGSTVYIYGDSLMAEMQSQLQFQLGVDHVNSVVKAAGGTALCDWIPTIEADVRSARPATVVVLFSGNALTACMSGFVSGPAMVAKYRADLDTLEAWLHTEGTPLIIAGAPPCLHRTADPVLIPTTWAVGQIPQGYEQSEPALNDMYQAAVAGYQALGWAAGYIGAGSAVAAPGGGWTYVLPCLPFETSDMGCDAVHLIVVRAPDLAHLCSADPATGWCGGAWRYATGISSYVSTHLPTSHGYWMAASDGGLFAFGPGIHFYGSAAGTPLPAPIVGMAGDPATGGYWLVASDGRVFAFNAPSYGSMAGRELAQPIVGMAAAPDGLGYWLLARDGGVFAFGASARFYGSAAGTARPSPFVGMAVDGATGGYWLVASDGSIFAFRAPFLGSTAGVALNQPVVGMAGDPATGGYWLVASDGGIFAFGTPFLGSTGGLRLDRPVVGMATDAATGGYWLVASDGGIFAFGAPFLGSTGGLRLDRPVVGIAGAP